MKQFFLVLAIAAFSCSFASAQDMLPVDDGIYDYHTAPRYRETESHPLRILAYVVHPIGWAARELIARPLSYFAASTPTTRSVMGYREPYDYRQPECFSADDSAPDCRTIVPFDYDMKKKAINETAAAALSGDTQVYFPDVNFDFDRRSLNDLGEGQARRIAKLLQDGNSNLKVVLQGHTDYVGSESYNEKLGLDRADTVRQELIGLGVTPERLSSVTFGETQPLFQDQENWARAVNRRVEVHSDGSVVPPAPQVPSAE